MPIWRASNKMIAFLTWVACVVAITLGCGVFADMESGMLPIFMIVGGPFAAVAFTPVFALPWLLRKATVVTVRRVAAVLVALALLFFCLCCWNRYKVTRPEARFRTYVCAAELPSVRNIRVEGINYLLQKQWLIAFDIDRRDVESIVRLRRLRCTERVDLRQILAPYGEFTNSAVLHELTTPDTLQCYQRLTGRMPSYSRYLVFDEQHGRAWFLYIYSN